MRIRLRLCLHLLFALFAVFLTSLNSLATQTAALPTKFALLAASSSVTTMTTEESVSRSGGEIGLNAECRGLAKAFHVLPSGIPKLNCGIFAEIGRTFAAKGIPRITEKGLARVESHLDDVLNNQFGDLSRSTGLKFQAGERGMLERLRSGATSPQDIEFYVHELRESARFRSSGDLMKAHNEALQWRGVTSQDLFHPEVMQANPQIFGGRP